MWKQTFAISAMVLVCGFILYFYLLGLVKEETHAASSTTIIQVKVIEENNLGELQKRTNYFLQNFSSRQIVDIKYQAVVSSLSKIWLYSVLITYME